MVQSLPRVVRSNRIPPHNLDAEQSVLGAMLESREAIANVLEILDPEDFYKPAHATIYEAILGLFGKGEPVDAITVADELTRRAHLEGIGGKPYIHGLLEAYPTASSAAHYARIVDEHAMLRRLVSAGNEIQEIGFALPDDVPQAVDRSEELIYEVGNRRLRGDVAPLRGLLTEAMVDIETLFERGEPITGVRTGFHDLDEITTGFQPANLVIVAARPSMGKCLRASSLIDDPRTGERVTIKDFVERRSPRTMNVDPDGSIVETEVTDWVPNGRRDCWRLTTRSGRTIVATDNHPFLKVAGWTPLSQLKIGDRIAVPREVPVFGDCDWSGERIRLLAYFIAEGGLTGGMPRFTNADPVIVDDFERCVYEEFEWCAVTNVGLTYTVRYIGDRFRGCNDVTAWLKSLDLMGKSALEKRFPAVVWTFSREQLIDFVRIMMSCDGTVYPLGGYARIEFSVASEGLARDMHHAFTRLGIVSKFWFKKERCWRVEITEPASVDRYQTEIGWLGEKARRRFSERSGDRARRGNIGAPPAEVWELVRKALDNAGMSLGELSRRCGENASNPHTRRALPQRRLAMYAEVLDDDDLRFLANPDLYWDEVVSIEHAGEHDVYDVTVPMGSNFIADDICVHNSSLLSDFALASGKSGQPVVLFSLEMSRQEVVQRFLSSEARVDSQRIRKGTLQEQDWPRLSAALGRLAELPIFIDDSANVSIMEMRAKCRRLKARHGLSLVIIDYLQLMQTTSRSENRQQEVSEISRALKILARDLEVPVLCASQLNRGVEYRADKRPLLADLRESGCLVASTKVRLSTGESVPIEELVGRTPDVLSCDNMMVVSRTATKVWKTGTREVFELVTKSGRVVRATDNHPFKTIDGWRALADLRTGEAIASVDGLDVFWDVVESMTPSGVEDVFDMTVPGMHNFVANDLIVHNSIEQDSDVVMFLYRDEVYNPDTDARGEAELIIGKHRNGPTGVVRLAFMNQYTKFASIAKGI